MYRYVMAVMTLLLVIMIWRVWNDDPIVTYLYLTRVPVVVGLLMLVYPLIASSKGLRPLLGNTLVLDRARQISTITMTSILCGWTVLACARTTLIYASARFGVSYLTDHGWAAGFFQWALTWRVLIPMILAAPIIAAVCIKSSEIPKAKRALAVLVGLVATYCVMVVASLTFAFSVGRVPDEMAGAASFHNFLLPYSMVPFAEHAPLISQEFSRISRWLIDADCPDFLRGFGSIYVDPLSHGSDDPDIIGSSGHVLNAVLFAVTLAFYGFIGIWAYPRRQNEVRVSALGYVILTTMLMCFVMSGATFFFDYFHVPVVLVALGMSWFWYTLSDADHHFRLHDYDPPPPRKSTSNGREMTDLEAYVRLSRDEDTFVLVSASGGGIQAAMWTAHALQELETENGQPFRSTLRAVSSVSGGSVGALHYLDRFDPGASCRISAKKDCVEAASESSIHAMAWGLAYPDLARLFMPLAVKGKFVDRGWALEKVWEESLCTTGRPTLRSWRNAVMARQMPVPLINTTVTETGRPFVFSPVTWFDKAGLFADAPDEFARIFPLKDVRLVTAARLSATFPYISPTAQPKPSCGFEKHFADGGYFDNYGTHSLLRWLDRVLVERRRQRIDAPRILLIQINLDPVKSVEEIAEGGKGWRQTFLGPALTVLNVRGASQKIHRDTEVKLMRHRIIAAGGVFETATLRCVGDLPLSWKLTKSEKEQVREAWNSQENFQARKLVQQFLADEKMTKSQRHRYYGDDDFEELTAEF